MPPLLILHLSANAGTIKFDWMDRNFTIHDLTRDTSPLVFVTKGTKGLGQSPVNFEDEKFPLLPGGALRHIATRPREIELPIIVRETNLTDLMIKVAQVRDWFYPGNELNRYGGYLRITPPDGELRQIFCYPREGLEGDLEAGGLIFTQLVITLVAPNPYFTAPDEETASWTNDSNPQFESIINSGELETYPVWKIHGPATSVNINNLSTGLGWLYADSLAGWSIPSGKYLQIDTRPASQRTTLPVIDSDGVNRYSSFHRASTMFKFSAGQNDLSIAGDHSLLEVEWLPLYHGVLR